MDRSGFVGGGIAGCLALLVTAACVAAGAVGAVRPVGVAASGHAAAAPARLPSYELSDFTPVGAHTAWVLTTSNAVGNAPQAVLRSSDGGLRWSTVTPTLAHPRGVTSQLTAADFVNASLAWIAYGPVSSNARQTLWVTVDAGRRWTEAGQVAAGCVPDFVNRHVGWCVITNGATGSESLLIYRTTDGARVWHLVERTSLTSTISSPDAIPFGCDKVASLNTAELGFVTSAFCAGSQGYIVATTDGGLHWHLQLSLSPPTATDQSGASFTAVVGDGTDAAAGFTVDGVDGPAVSVIYHTSDGGRHWNETRPPGVPAGYSVDIVTPRIWRLVLGHTVLGTVNGGASWNRITADVGLGSPDTDQIRFTTAQVGWAIPLGGLSVGVRHTADGGRRWTAVHIPAPR